MGMNHTEYAKRKLPDLRHVFLFCFFASSLFSLFIHALSKSPSDSCDCFARDNTGQMRGCNLCLSSLSHLFTSIVIQLNVNSPCELHQTKKKKRKRTCSHVWLKEDFSCLCSLGDLWPHSCVWMPPNYFLQIKNSANGKGARGSSR